jgi:cytochrome c peroxidase
MRTLSLLRRLAIILTLFGAVACQEEAQPSPKPPLTAAVAPPGFPAGPVTDTAPADNALTEARALLGKRLFFDVRLSRTREISCASCHQQEYAFSDPNPVSTGVEGRTGKRNAPALVNLAWGASFFWDGRSPTLEDQAGRPIEDELEMDKPLATVVAELRVDAEYRRAFLAAYADEPSELNLRQALASFVRTLVSADSAYDRFLRGDASAFSPAAQRGESLFFHEPVACFHCHSTGTLTNEGFFNNGSYEDGGDAGRELVTERVGDRGKFKVPGLRNVAVTAPYMHDGSIATLAGVLEQYEHGGRGDPTTDPQIQPLGLSDSDKQDLLAFLESLTDESFLSDARFKP